MLVWLGLALAVAVAGALIPFISVELFVLGLVTQQPQVPWWALGLVIAIGQVGGKLPYFYLARGRLRIPVLGRRVRVPSTQPPEQPVRRLPRLSQRWARWLERFQLTCQGRPLWTFAVMLASGLASLPPYEASPIVAGVARVPPAAFVTASLLGRFVRFGALAAAPALVGWLT